MTEETRDPRTLRALAHPLRWKLIDLLASEGTVTATRCAAELGESVASCSYHLNILAKYGYIEQAPGGLAREKPWRLTDVRQNLSGAGLGPGGKAAAQAAIEVFLDHELGRLKERVRREDDEPEHWREATTLSGVTTSLTAEELGEVSAALREISLRYVDRTSDRGKIPPGAREVRIFIATSVAPPPPTARDDGP